MDKVCKQCGALDETRTETRGSIIIELILWLCFIVPGLVYSFWRLSTRREVCRCCGSADLVPADSPVGRTMVVKHHGARAADKVAVPRKSNAGAIGFAFGRMVRKVLP